MPRKQVDSLSNIVRVSLILCLVCSTLVSVFAVGLRPWQQENRQLDKKRNILVVADIVQPNQSVSSQQIYDYFKQSSKIWVEEKLIDLRSGDVVDRVEGFEETQDYDALLAAKDANLSDTVDPAQDFARIRRREHYTFVYFVYKKDQLDQILLPIRGMGLWSILHGFISLGDDLTTIRGIGFYEHGETPGLGGEVDNLAWKNKWKGKLAFDEDGTVRIEVIRGAVSSKTLDSQFEIDGLSGATFTSKGVTDMLRYWLGEHGFGPFLSKLRRQGRAHG